MSNAHMDTYREIYKKKLHPEKYPERLLAYSRNIKLTVEYDGTQYCGWQSQENGPSIQEEIEKALFKLTNEKTIVNGAGRTDAGVHAEKMTANFYTNSKIPENVFAIVLNRILPEDISVVGSEDVSMSFHSRFDAKGKHYKYKIRNSKYPSALDRHHAWWIKYCEKIDIDRMREAAKIFVGTHDFSGCMAVGSKIKNPIRTIYSINISRLNDTDIHIDFKGNGFLYNMVRIITGTLISCGKGKISIETVHKMLREKNRKLGGVTAPAHGLFLMEVYY